MKDREGVSSFSCIQLDQPPCICYVGGSGTYHAIGAENRVTGIMIWHISRRHVGSGFSLSASKHRHRTISDFLKSTGLQNDFVLQDWNALTQHDESTVKQQTLSNNMMYNNLSTRLVCLWSQAALPPLLYSFLQYILFGGESDGSSCSVKRNLFSFSANRTEADRRYEVDEPSWFNLKHLGGSLGDDMISSSLQPSSSGNQSPQPLSLVARRGEILQRITGSTLFLSTLKIIPKSARGKGLYNPYLIVIMYITMDTLINKQCPRAWK